MIAVHVDDLMFGGTDKFQKNVIEALKRKFKLSTEVETEFVYTGLDIRQSSAFINLSQIGYADQISEISIDPIRGRDNKLEINSHERSQLRSVCGQLLWVATQSRPDLGYATCIASNSYATGIISDLKLVNKTIKFMKNNPLTLKFPRIDLSSASVVIFCDASFANLRDGSSQGGHIVFVVDRSGKCSPLTWQSKKIKRVCKSTLAAESWSMIEAVESGELIMTQLCEVMRCSALDVVCITDCKSLFDAIHTTNTLEDKGLRIPVACLRQRVTAGEMRVRWIGTKHQIADCLTKAGASASLLRNVLSTGKLTTDFVEIIFKT